MPKCDRTKGKKSPEKQDKNYPSERHKHRLQATLRNTDTSDHRHTQRSGETRRKIIQRNKATGKKP